MALLKDRHTRTKDAERDAERAQWLNIHVGRSSRFNNFIGQTGQFKSYSGFRIDFERGCFDEKTHVTSLTLAKDFALNPVDFKI